MEEQNNQKETRSRRALLTVAITFAVLSAVLAAALIYYTVTSGGSGDSLDAGYRRSFYDTVVEVDNIDLNLSKAMATKDTGAMQSYLTDLAVNSELAESDLQQLPIEDENKFYTTKIVNQTGDFAKYLNKKIIKGEKVSSDDYKNLKSLYKANLALKNALQSAMREMKSDFDFKRIGENFKDNAFLRNFDELQEMSVEFPELIYDGPFSDGKDRAKVKGLSGRTITEAEAADIFAERFSEYSPENIRNAGKSTGRIEAFCVEADINSEKAYAQISVVGGKLLMYAFAGSCNGINYGEEAAVEKAREFLNREIADDLTAVWINLSNNLYTINFAPKVSGAIVYPDLIKVRVCAETGMIIGVEGTEYYKNHVERSVGLPALTAAEARSEVSDEIAVNSVRLAIVPIGESAERLCYEFSGEKDGAVYYIYIDAENGRQLEMFKVINSDEEGSLLM
ncbi:MAG: germination protein YpeB [Clostridia bacterium]|nr:germination protein YpeB [Clostridia bacterium]